MEITWSYGEAKALEKDAFPDPVWSYGGSVLFYEYEEAAASEEINVVFFGANF